MGWHLRCVACQSYVHALADVQLDLLRGNIEVAQLRREVEALLDEQVFDGILQGTLALRDERFEVTRTEWGAEQNVECGRRNEVRLKNRPNGGLAILLH